MVSSRKRGRQEMEATEAPREPSIIETIRNMWQFANLAQWIFIFGKAVKIDEKLDIEELEMECLKSHSIVLSDIGLALLKFVSSHRGLAPELFDEYTRRQYLAKAPNRNPFGTDEEPEKFAEFDIFTKIKILQQLTQWTMMNPDRIRERMEEQRDSEQTFWRIEPFGWDSDDRSYFVLDDNRLYRRTDPPPPPAPARPPKKNSKKARAALRASKRRKVSEAPSEDEAKDSEADNAQSADTEEDDGLGGAKWECLAITLEDLTTFLKTLERTRDPNEKVLRQRITEDLLPILEKQEESRKRKAAQQEKELLNLEKMANAKRSSRIASKIEHQREEQLSREAERKRQADLELEKKEQERWHKLEKERESRMISREQRLKEREAKRILHEAELASLSEDNKKLETGEGRISERHLKAEIEKKKQALEELAEEDDWVFDCICGAYGHVDDGTLSIACEKCNIWQHTKCVGVSDEEAGREDYHFICKTCIRRAKEAERAKKEEAERARKEAERAKREAERAAERARKAAELAREEAERAKNRPTIKIKLNRPGSSLSPAPPQALSSPPVNGGHASSSSPSSMSPKKPILFQHTEYPLAANGSPYQNQQVRPQSQGSSGPNGLHSPTYKLNKPSSNLTTGYSPQHYQNGSPPDQQGPNGSPISNGPNVYSSPNQMLQKQPLGSPNYPYPQGNSQFATGRSPYETSQNSTLGRVISHSPPASTPSNAQNSHGHAQLPNMYGQQQGDASQHRPSMTFPSPLTGVPVLSPSPPYQQAQVASPTTGSSFPQSSQYFTQQSMSAVLLSEQQASSAQKLEASLPKPESDHASALPPAITGISPTKHSPPRPNTASEGLNVATPAALPPVAPLSPSPRQQILSPPVKHSPPEMAPPAVLPPILSSPTPQQTTFSQPSVPDASQFKSPTILAAAVASPVAPQAHSPSLNGSLSASTLAPILAPHTSSPSLQRSLAPPVKTDGPITAPAEHSTPVSSLEQEKQGVEPSLQQPQPGSTMSAQ